ncbi:MAG: GyrI-like domain-containing protein [Anaerolineae bacterium]|nr:GyrI-like domain-containing protein [Anaerolineae bacterium]
MNNNVRLVDLPPLRVASFHAYGASPERVVLAQMQAWAERHGYLDDGQQHRIFGFDNPIPSPGSPNYGYEVWFEVAPEQAGDGDETVTWKEMPGGRYAVLRCEALPDGSNIPAAWEALARWLEESHYHYPPQRQCLEEHLGHLALKPGHFVLDLYLPIEE